MTYTLNATRTLVQNVTSDPFSPFGRAVSAVMADGSFAVAVWMQCNTAGGTHLLRVWRLSALSLAVIGTADFPMAAGGSIVGYRIGASSLVVHCQQSGVTESWEIDCSSTTPVSKAHASTALSSNYQAGIGSDALSTLVLASGLQLMAGMQPGNNTVAVQVWDGVIFKGQVVFDAGARTYVGGPAWAKTDDANKAAFFLGVGGQEVNGYLEVDVTDSAAPTASWHGYGYPTSDWTFGMDNPYAAAAPRVLGEFNSALVLREATGALVSSAGEASNTGTNWNGPNVSYLSDRWANLCESIDYSVPYPYVYAGRLVGVDPAETSVEVLALPYADLPAGTVSLSAGTFGLAADPISGATCACACVVGADNVTYSVLAWSIQGPSNSPNLTGKPAGVQLTFSGA